MPSKLNSHAPPPKMYRQLLVLAVANVVCAMCAPTETREEQHANYDYSKYDTVYDQRQNGSENYKVDVNGVVVVWASPESVLSALALLDYGDYGDLEELLNPQKPVKPEALLEISPERPSSSTTTALPPSLAVTEGNAAQEAQNDTARQEAAKRKYRLPMFIRPFLSMRRH